MATPKKTKAKKGKAISSDITFHYQKTPSYRSFHVDGAHGGLSPKGNLHMNVFVERPSIPKIEKYKISGNNLELVSKDGKEGIIREVECELIMDYNSMRLIHKWLGEKIEEFDEKFRIKGLN